MVLNTFVRIPKALLLSALFVSLFLQPAMGSAEQSAQNVSQTLVKLEGEVLEVEELKEPKGSAIYTVKDLASGQTLKLYADSYRALVRMGGALTSANGVLGGSKVTIIYRRSSGESIPSAKQNGGSAVLLGGEVVFAKVTSSYYS